MAAIRASAPARPTLLLGAAALVANAAVAGLSTRSPALVAVAVLVVAVAVLAFVRPGVLLLAAAFGLVVSADLVDLLFTLPNLGFGGFSIQLSDLFLVAILLAWAGWELQRGRRRAAALRARTGAGVRRVRPADGVRALRSRARRPRRVLERAGVRVLRARAGRRARARDAAAAAPARRRDRDGGGALVGRGRGARRGREERDRARALDRRRARAVDRRLLPRRGGAPLRAGLDRLRHAPAAGARPGPRAPPRRRRGRLGGA